MTTVEAVIDRCFRTYLEPPNEQPAYCTLNVGVDASESTLQLSSFEVPEDVNLLRIGSRIEINQELMRVLDVTETPALLTVTVTRAMMGSDASNHAAGSLVKLSPRWARLSVFEAVADNILTLYDDLFTVETLLVPTVDRAVGPMEDPLAVEVLEAWPDAGGVPPIKTMARIVDYHPNVGGRAVVFIDGGLGSYWVKYRRRMGKAEAESDTLDVLGVDERWTNIVIIGTAADLLVGQELSKSQTDWISKALEAQNVPIGTRQDLATTMAGYRNELIRRAKSEMAPEYEPRVQMNNPFDDAQLFGGGY